MNFRLVISGSLQCVKTVHGHNDVVAALLEKSEEGSAVVRFILCQQDCLFSVGRQFANSSTTASLE